MEEVNTKYGFYGIVLEDEDDEFIDAVSPWDITEWGSVGEYSLDEVSEPYEGERTPQVGEVWQIHPVRATLRSWPGPIVELKEEKSFPNGTTAGFIGEVVQIQTDSFYEKGDIIKIASQELVLGEYIRDS